MKIDRQYCMMMARYNTWQNRQFLERLCDVDPTELTRNRGAFFGSILATLSHLLWGDHIWMSRFDGGSAPEVAGDKSTTFAPTLGAWEAERFRIDDRIRLWAEALDDIDLDGDLVWYSGMSAREMNKPMAICVVHMFNHQTHHRGQVHAMMTGAGLTAPVSDLIFMPDEGA